MIAFWILAPIMVVAALGILFVRKAVHAALLLAVVMISLAVLYAALDAPFLFAVQIIVYTGAILMLFLFVVMLVGVDASDSVVETIRGQRVMATSSACCSASSSWSALGQVTFGTVIGLDKANEGGNVPQLANLLFSKYVFAFETTWALLITAAIGAMVLAHRERLTPEADPGRRGRRRMQEYADTGKPPRSAAGPGRLRPPQRGRHPGAAARRHRRARPRSRGCSPPAAPCAPRRPSPTTSTRCSASSATTRAGQTPRDPGDRRGGHRMSTDALHRPLGDPVHHRLRRRARPPQRDRGVHVHRADAQRLEPRAGDLRQGRTATSRARSQRSS